MILGHGGLHGAGAGARRAVDKRADIWAFGCVLFEMLTGQPCFAGEDVTDTLAAVVKTDPEWTALPSRARRRPIRQLLRRCLEKDRKQRLHDIADARLEIEAAPRSPVDVPSGPSSTVTATAAASAGYWPRRSATLFGLVPLSALIVALAAVLYWSLVREVPPDVTTYTDIALPDGHALFSGPAISPDGRVLAFVSAGPAETPRLYVRHLTRGFEERAVPGTEDAAQPFFSPDGRHVAYFAKGQLYRVSVDGGIPTLRARAPAALGGSWGDDDSIIFAGTAIGGLIQVKGTGMTAEKLVIRPDGVAAYAFVQPSFLPGARQLLFAVYGRDAGIEALEIATGKRSRLIPEQLCVRMAYADSGHLIYANVPSAIRGQLLAIPYSPGRAPLDQTPGTVLQDVFVDYYKGQAWFGLSRNGTLVHAVGNISHNALVRVDPSGRIVGTLGRPGFYGTVSLSPNGDRVVYVRDGKIIVQNLQRGGEVVLTTEAEAPAKWEDRYPIWNADGSRVVYSSIRTGNWDLYSRDASGQEATPDLLLPKEFSQYPGSIREDGTLVFTEEHPDTAADIYSLRPGGKPEAWRVTPKQEHSPRFSPDGRLIAYVSDENERFEIYVSAFDKKSERIQVSTEGGRCPVWSAKGDRLFYRQGTMIMVIDIGPNGTPAGRSRVLFEGGWSLATWRGLPVAPTRPIHPDFAVMSNGDFLMVKAEPGAIPTKIRVIFNWFEELKAKVPTGR